MVKTWLTLSKADTPYEKQIALKDLFKPTEQFLVERGVSSQIEVRKLEILVAKTIYQVLGKNGIIIHPSLKTRYKDQGSCIFCGGAIHKIEDIEKKTFEKRCEDCLYIYEEQ